MSGDSHYQVLGIDRTADARAIKKAYFALIRKFSPEADPDAFQRIRRAYEVLSDPEQKDRYDEAEKGFSELDSAVGERLRAIAEASKESSADAIIEMLKELVADHADVAVAHEQLAFALSQKGLNEEALEQFTWLCDKEPDNARWPFHRGVALGRLGQFKESLPFLERAVDADPAQVPARLALSEVLTELDRAKGGIARLEEGIAAVEADSQGYYALVLRKAELLYRIGKTTSAEETLRACTSSVKGADDADKRRFVAGQVASLAAKLFAKNEMEAANRALAVSAELVPEHPVERPFPVSSKLLASSLDERVRAWLAGLPTGPTTPTVPEAVWTAPFLTTLLGILSLFGVSMAAADGSHPTLCAIGAAAAAVPLAWGLTMIGTLMSGPLRGFITVHPLWVIRARGDKMQVFSLFSLASTNGTHHHTNGVYTHTSIILAFGGEKRETVTVSIRNQGYAQAWLSYLWETRGRSLELLSEGFLEAEGGVDLLPPAEVLRASALPTSGRRGPAWKLLVPLVVASALVVGVYARAKLGDRALVAALGESSLPRLIEHERVAASRGRAATVSAVVDRSYATAVARLDGGPLAPLVDEMKKQRKIGMTCAVGSRIGPSQALATALDAGVTAMGIIDVLSAASDRGGLVLDVVEAAGTTSTKWAVRATVGGTAVSLGEVTTAPVSAGELPPAVEDELVTKVGALLGIPVSAKQATR